MHAYERRAYEMAYGGMPAYGRRIPVRGTPMRWSIGDARLRGTCLWEIHAYERHVHERHAYEVHADEVYPEQPSLPNICHSIQNSSPWSLKLPNNECSSWNLKIFDNGIRVCVGCNARSGRRVSESEVVAPCLKNSAGGLKNVFNYSSRCSRFGSDDIMFVSGNW
jgi:hypothetical protein